MQNSTSRLNQEEPEESRLVAPSIKKALHIGCGHSATSHNLATQRWLQQNLLICNADWKGAYALVHYHSYKLYQ
jgi:hypothetical protein